MSETKIIAGDADAAAKEPANRREVIYSAKYTRADIYIVTAAALFLVGAVFMLTYTFADLHWAFWAGVPFAVIASVFLGLSFYENKRSPARKVTKLPATTAEKNAADKKSEAQGNDTNEKGSPAADKEDKGKGSLNKSFNSKK